MSAPITTASAGSASMTRCGVGPAARRFVKTSTVDSRPNAVATAAASCSATATSVQRGAARHDQAVSTMAVRGAPRATVQIPAWLASSWLLAQYGVSISAAPMSGSSPTGPSSATGAARPRRVSARRRPYPRGVPDRLSPLDASFLFAEDRTRPMHIGGVMTFAAPGGFDFDAFVALIGRRLGLVPRWRQKVREVPVHLGLPVWVDDADFDLDYHVRRSALPALRHRRAAAGAGRAAGRPAAGPVAAALGDLPRRGSGGRPVRRGHQDPPRDGRRPRIDGRRDAAARRQPGRARHPARRLVPRPGAVVTGSGDRRRARGDAAAPHGARCRRPGPRGRP